MLKLRLPLAESSLKMVKNKRGLKSPRRNRSFTGSRPVTWTRPTSNAGENIRVVARVRPLSDREDGSNSRNIIKVVDDHTIVFDPKEDEPFVCHGVQQRNRDIMKRTNKNLHFTFDQVFGFEADNNAVFQNSTKCLIQTLMKGYNCSVFVYGATGAGKTHTMLGSGNDPGITFLTMKELFQQKGELSRECDFEVSMTYLEVYNETVQDLLNPGPALQLREDVQHGVVVAGIQVKRIEQLDTLFEFLEQGNRNRTQHPTDANSESSRSHAVFQVYLRMKFKVSGEVLVAKLSMIDLAGSESGAATGYTGARFAEGANINKSLLALGNCINSLAHGHRHVPYRDSKLTRLLKGSLGGNCQTIMVANVSPSFLSYEDTYNTLKYAVRAKKIKSNMKKNVVNCEMNLNHYIKLVDELTKENEQLKLKISALTDMVTSDVKEAESNINETDGATIKFGKAAEETINNINHFKNRRSWTKKNTCLYCLREVMNFARHLKRHHSEEGAVKKLLAVPLKDPKRKHLYNVLRKQGNYASSSKFIRPVQRSKGNESESIEEGRNMYAVCRDCKGFYKRNYLGRHRKTCRVRAKNRISRRENHLSESQMVMICDSEYSEFYNSLRIKEEVFKTMKADERSRVAMGDILICSYAESFLQNHRRPQIKATVSQKMRELGRLLIFLRETNGVQRLIDVLKPEFFDNIVSATKLISGYDPESQTYAASSLALHMGTTLRQVCDIAIKLIIDKNKFIPCSDPERSVEDIKQLRRLIENHWNSEVCTVALKENNKASKEDFSLQNPDSTTPVTTAQKKTIEPIKRVRWTEDQKRVVTEHFSYHIKNEIAPKKKEVQELMRKHEQLFENKNWVTVKAYVYNCYRQK